MTTDIMKELEEMLPNVDTAYCDECDSHDEDDITKNLKILSPNSDVKVGLLTDLRQLSHKLEKALKTCNHRLQLLIFQESRVRFVCEICNLKEDLYDEGTTEQESVGSNVEDSEDTLELDESYEKDDSSIIVESPTPQSKDDNDKLLVTEGVILSTSPSQSHKSSSRENLESPRTTSDLNQREILDSPQKKDQESKAKSSREDEDAEIDQLLMDSPDSKKILTDETNLKDSEDEGMLVDLLYPEVTMKDDLEESHPMDPLQRTSTPTVKASLRLKPFSELQPLVPGLPQYTSQKIEAGVNPMNLPGPWNIDNYGKDDSLEECVAETPSSNSNMMVGKVTFKIVTPSETLKQRRPSPVPGPGHQTIPNIHGIQHRQQAPGQFSQMAYLQQQQQYVQASIRRVSPGGAVQSPPGLSNQVVRARMTTQFSEASNSQQIQNRLQQHQQQFRFGQPQPSHHYSQPQAPGQFQLQGSSQNRARLSHGLQAAGPNITRLARPEIPLFHDPRLPPGWGRSIQRTASGECFVVIYDPAGRKFRSREEIRSFVTSQGISGIDPSKVDFSVFGQAM